LDDHLQALCTSHHVDKRDLCVPPPPVYLAGDTIRSSIGAHAWMECATLGKPLHERIQLLIICRESVGL
jgi:hypothetical protein